MSDIVDRLRGPLFFATEADIEAWARLTREAADEIERLRAIGLGKIEEIRQVIDPVVACKCGGWRGRQSRLPGLPDSPHCPACLEPFKAFPSAA